MSKGHTGWRTRAICAGSLLGIAGSALGLPPYTVKTLTLQDASVPGVGLVSRIDRVTVDNDGRWLVEVDTDNADTGRDGVLLGEEGIVLREGDAVDAPVDAVVHAMDTWSPAGDAGRAGVIFLSGAVGPKTDSGIYLGGTLVLREGSVSTAPEFGPATSYLGFFEVKLNDSRQILAIAIVDDLMIPSGVDRAAVLLAIDADGFLVSETALVKEGDAPDGLPPVSDIAAGPHSSAFNSAGDALLTLLLDGTLEPAGAVAMGDQVLARTGEASPVPGRNWGSMLGAAVALSDTGHTAIRARLDGDVHSAAVIVVDGQLIAQESGPVPGVPGKTLLTLAESGPVGLDDQGHTVWWGAWDGPGAALFWDDEPLIQRGITELEGIPVGAIDAGENSFAFSSNGRFLIFKSRLENGYQGAFLVEFEQSCYADCDGAGGLDLFDFLCFTNSFVANGEYADCDGSGGWDLFDFLCFTNAFVGGCP